VLFKKDGGDQLPEIIQAGKVPVKGFFGRLGFKMKK